MQKRILSITLNVFEKDKNNLERIFDVYHDLLPLDFQKEKIVIKTDNLEGFNNKIIYSISLETTKNNHNTLLLDSLLRRLEKSDIQKIYNQINSRLNDDGYFYIRVDKNSLLHRIVKLTDDGDCFHIKIKIAAYPAKRQKFIESIQSLLNEYIKKDKKN